MPLSGTSCPMACWLTWRGWPQSWAPAVVESLDADGYNLLQNNGAAAGQEVMHVHLHLIPRWQQDGYFGGGSQHRIAEPDELNRTAALLRAAHLARG